MTLLTFSAIFLVLLVFILLLTWKFNASKNFPIIALVAGTLFLAQLNMAEIDTVRSYDLMTLSIPSHSGDKPEGEVWIDHLVIDGRKHKVTESVSGEWFWWNNKYGWRYRPTPRLETRSVQIKVPRGGNRQIVMDVGPDMGQVEISLANETVRLLDLTAPTKGVQSFNLPPTNAGYIQARYLKQLAKYGCHLVFWVFISLTAYGLYFKFSPRLDPWLARHWSSVLIVAIGLAGGVFSLKYASVKSLWVDDLYQIIKSHPNQTFMQVIATNALWDVPPPLFSFIAFLWLKIAPYGTFWLRLLPTVFTVMGFIMCGFTARRLFNPVGGIICVMLCSSWMHLYAASAHIFRAYGLLFFACSVVLYCFINKYVSKDQPPDRRAPLKFGASLVLLAYSHYFGVPVIIGLFMSEALLTYKRKASLKFVFPYLISGLTLLPWIIYVLNHAVTITNFWPRVPDLKALEWMIDHLLFNNGIAIIKYGLCLGVAVMAAGFIRCLATGKQVDDALFILLTSFGIVFFVVGGNYIFSTTIKPNTPLFINRYLIPALPFLFMLLTYGLLCLVRLLKRGIPQSAFCVFIFLVGSLPGLLDTYKFITTHVPRHNYEGVANYLNRQLDIDEPQVLVVYMSVISGVGDIYYLSHNGAIPPVKYARLRDLKQKDIEHVNKVYLLFHHTDSMRIEAHPNYELITNTFKKTGEKKELQLMIYERKWS